MQVRNDIFETWFPHCADELELVHYSRKSQTSYDHETCQISSPEYYKNPNMLWFKSKILNMLTKVKLWCSFGDVSVYQRKYDNLWL